MPQFLPDTQILKRHLQSMGRKELKALWRCNDRIVAENVARLRGMDLERNLTPALLAYKGIQYDYMAPGVFTYDELGYIGEHLRILSGFYGILEPFCGVALHRLEMQAKLETDRGPDLYRFWGSAIAQTLSKETDQILDLASKEYSRAVLPHLPERVRVARCTFGEEDGDRVVQKGTLCKMARGRMVRFLAERSIADLGQIKEYTELGYSYSPKHSTPDDFVFTKTSRGKGGAKGGKKRSPGPN